MVAAEAAVAEQPKQTAEGSSALPLAVAHPPQQKLTKKEAVDVALRLAQR
jgi:hypothetical protein